MKFLATKLQLQGISCNRTSKDAKSIYLNSNSCCADHLTSALPKQHDQTHKFYLDLSFVQLLIALHCDVLVMQFFLLLIQVLLVIHSICKVSDFLLPLASFPHSWDRRQGLFRILTCGETRD